MHVKIIITTFLDGFIQKIASFSHSVVVDNVICFVAMQYITYSVTIKIIVLYEYKLKNKTHS